MDVFLREPITASASQKVAGDLPAVVLCLSLSLPLSALFLLNKALLTRRVQLGATGAAGHAVCPALNHRSSNQWPTSLPPEPLHLQVSVCEHINHFMLVFTLISHLRHS